MSRPKLSVLSAVHEGREKHRLFWETLCQNTLSPFELILIDNQSSDGTQTDFQKLALSAQSDERRLVYLRNETEVSTPAWRRQAMAHASADIFVFLDGDAWVPPGWHLPFERELERHPWQVLSASGRLAQPTRTLARTLDRRWKRVERFSRFWKLATRASEKQRLLKALTWMYGDLDRFQSPTPAREPDFIPGIQEGAVAFHRRLLEKLPRPWDPQREGADRHLYLNLANLNELDPDVPLPKILLDTYVHRFGSEKNFESEEKFWGEAALKRLWWTHLLPEH